MPPLTAVDISSSLQALGNPGDNTIGGLVNLTSPYGRNPWDIVDFDNKLFVFMGNGSNTGPAGEGNNNNIAPGLIAYTPGTASWANEATISGFQCGAARIFDLGSGSELTLFALDPNPDSLTFYHRPLGGVWGTDSTSNGVQHAYAHYYFSGSLFVPINDSSFGGYFGTVTLPLSSHPMSWTAFGTATSTRNSFVLGGSLYVTAPITTAIVFPTTLYKWTGSAFSGLTGPKFAQWFPSTTPDTSAQAQLHRPLTVTLNSTEALYYVAAKSVNEHQTNPYTNSLYRCTAISSSGSGSVTTALIDLDTVLSVTGSKVWDLKYYSGTLYALAEYTTGGGSHRGSILSTTNGTTWTEVYYWALPQADVFPRSFALLNGIWYVGYGAGSSTTADTTYSTASKPFIGDIVSYDTATVPDAPTIGTATGGTASASVTFTAPGNNGGSAITGYTATSTPGSHTGTGASSPITVSGLTNGTAYTFTVHATNAVGNSAESSASNSVTPSGGSVPTYFVRAANIGGGSDVANGTSWATAWATIAHAIATVAAGDTVYLKGQFFENFAPTTAGTSPSHITWIGDYDGSHTDGNRSVVRVTSAAANNQTASRTNTLAIAVAYNDFTGIAFDGATSVAMSLAAGAHDIVFDKCAITVAALNAACVSIAGAAQANITFKRCKLENFRNGRCIDYTHSSNVDNAGHLIENCVLLGGPGGGVTTTRVGGITIRNSLFRHLTTHFQVLGALTVGQTVTINNCRFEGGTNGLVGTVSGEIIEDYNNFVMSSPRTLTATGANSNTFLPLSDERPWFELVA